MSEWICGIGISGLGQILFWLTILSFAFWMAMKEWGWWKGILALIGFLIASLVAALLIMGIFCGLAWLLTKVVCP